MTYRALNGRTARSAALGAALFWAMTLNIWTIWASGAGLRLTSESTMNAVFTAEKRPAYRGKEKPELGRLLTQLAEEDTHEDEEDI